MSWSRALLVSVDDYPMIGGISTYYRSVAKALAEQDRQISLFTHATASDDPGRSFEVIRECSQYPLGVNGMKKHLRYRSICRQIDRLCAARDFEQMLLFHPFEYGAPAVRAARRQRLPVSSVYYGFEVRCQLDRTPDVRQRLILAAGGAPTMRQSLEITMRSSSRIFTISDYTKGLIEQIESETPIEIIGCGIALDRLRAEMAETPHDAAELKKARRISAGYDAAPMMIFVGRLVKSKNVAFLLQLLERLPGHQALIVGDGPERLSLQNEAAERGLLDRVRFTGYVDEDRKWLLFRLADYCTLFSREMPDGGVEGFGIVLLEGAAAGALPVTVRSGGMPDAVGQGATGLLGEPGDVSAMAEAIGAVSDGERSTLVAAARRAIEIRLNWTVIAARLAASLPTSRDER